MLLPFDARVERAQITSSSVKPAASASASTRVTNARSRRSCSRGGCASAGVALMNDPTPRRVSMTPARSSSA